MLCVAEGNFCRGFGLTGGGIFVSMNIKKRTEEINKAIDFHIEEKDYLLTLATFFLLLSAEKGLRSDIATRLSEMAYEMLYTEKHYRIIPRKVPKKCDLSIAESRMWQHWQLGQPSPKNRSKSKRRKNDK
jgi:hypothetical protein